MPKEIIIEIGENGELELRAEGFKGGSCEKATAFIEEALGMTEGKRKKLPAFFLTEVTKTKQKVG